MAVLWAFTMGIALGAVSNINTPHHIQPIKVLKLDESLEIIENEQAGVIHILNNAPIREIRIYNTKGTLVRTESKLNSDHRLDVDRLIDGLYAIRIQIKDEVHTYVYNKK